MDDFASPTPVIVITGYAASGKTVLVNRLLAACEKRGLKAGVICHRQAEEYGIEPSAVDSNRAAFYSTIYDFGSGCICCSPKGDLTRILRELVQRRAATPPLRLDVLILRLGPLAAPLVFAKAVCTTDEVSDVYEVASIAAVVDATLAPRHFAEDSAEWQARSQCACADLILVNTHVNTAHRMLNATAAMQSEAASLAAALNAEATIEMLPGEGAGLDALLSRRAFSLARARLLDPSFATTNNEAPAQLLSLTAHDRRLAAGCAVEPGALYWPPLRTLCERLAASGSALRIKGYVQLRGDVNGIGDADAVDVSAVDVSDVVAGEAAAVWMHIEGVEDSVTFRRASPPVTDGTAASKLYVLGRKLEVGSLRRDFQLCRVPRGYTFAADPQIHFGRRLTAASTTTAGLAPRPRAVLSDVPGVVVLRVGDEGGDEAYIPVERPATYASDAAFSEAAADIDHEASLVTILTAQPAVPSVVIDGAIYIRTPACCS